MKTVTTKEELKAALEAKTDKIIIKGKLAEEIQTKMKAKKYTGIGVGIASLAAAPFTGGTSLGAGILALTGWQIVALAGVIGALLLGGGALMKGYDVKLKTLDGTEIELTKKKP